MDLTAFYAPYEGDGRRKSPYEPRMMLKVLIYGYATGVVSSRGMARKLEEDEARGRKPGQKCNPKGGRGVQARVRGAGREGAGQFYGPAKPDHEDLRVGVSSHATTRRWRWRGRTS